MGDLFWNKVFGALLAVALGVMGLRVLSETVFSEGHGGGDHHGEEEMTLNDWAHSRFAYYTDIAETGGGGAEVRRRGANPRRPRPTCRESRSRRR